jgi:hypothetical protein
MYSSRTCSARCSGKGMIPRWLPLIQGCTNWFNTSLDTILLRPVVLGTCTAVVQGYECTLIL